MSQDDRGARPFVLGGSIRWGRPSGADLAAWAAVVAAILIPLRGLYRATGASMEEGFMLVFPRLVQDGQVANVDFLHLYGPGSIDALALWYRVVGDSLESQRTFGLLQHLAIVSAIYALARVSGRMAAVAASWVAIVLIMMPAGLTALAWHGALGAGLWAVVFASRARATGSPGSWWTAGMLAGIALAFRPDMVVALGAAAVFAAWRRPTAWRWGGAGAIAGLLPMWWHLVRAGPVRAIDGMVIDPVVRLRPGRELPRPPTWSQVDGALQAVAESLPPWWRLPAPTASQQLFIWFFAVIAISFAVVVGAAVAHRRRATPATAAVLIAALFGLGVLPQALQRPDSTHLAWVAVASWPLAVAMVSSWASRRFGLAPWQSALGVLVLSGVTLAVAAPFYTYRTYLLHTRVSIGDLPAPFEIEREGHRFWVGDPAVADAMAQMMPVLTARSEPGDTLIVGPGDLARTVYADTYVYWLFPELEPGTYFIEMDPGLADAEGSGLADEVAAADFVVLTNTWSGWTEPNTSAERRSDEANRAVAEHHCLVDSYLTNLVLLFEACDGGGGFDPSTVAGRAGGVFGGGVEERREP